MRTPSKIFKALKLLLVSITGPLSLSNTYKCLG